MPISASVLKIELCNSESTFSQVEIHVAALRRRHHVLRQRWTSEVTVRSGHGEAVAVQLVPQADVGTFGELKKKIIYIKFEQILYKT